MSEGNGMAEGSEVVSGEGKAISQMTKKRYNSIADMLKRELPSNEEKVNSILVNIREIMNFDPNATTYNKDRREYTYKYRTKKAEEMGTTVYKAFNFGKYYKKKEKPVDQTA